MADFTVSGSGSIYFLTPNTPEAEELVTEKLSGNENMHMGTSVVVEHGYISNLVYNLIENDGLTVEQDGHELFIDEDGDVARRVE